MKLELKTAPLGRHPREREARVGDPGKNLQYGKYLLGPGHLRKPWPRIKSGAGFSKIPG